MIIIVCNVPFLFTSLALYHLLFRIVLTRSVAVAGLFQYVAQIVKLYHWMHCEFRLLLSWPGVTVCAINANYRKSPRHYAGSS